MYFLIGISKVIKRAALTLILDGLNSTASNHRDNGVIFCAYSAISNNVDISLSELKRTDVISVDNNCVYNIFLSNCHNNVLIGYS